MTRMSLKLASWLTAVSLCAGTLAPALAHYDGYAKKTTTTAKVKQYLDEHPKVKSAAVGAGVGTAAGAVTGLVSGKGIVRGAAIGAGTGAAVGLIRSSKTLKRHPVVKDVATGTAIGLGLGLAANRGHGKGKKVAAATAVGAAVGLGVGVYRDKLK